MALEEVIAFARLNSHPVKGDAEYRKLVEFLKGNLNLFNLFAAKIVGEDVIFRSKQIAPVSLVAVRKWFGEEYVHLIQARYSPHDEGDVIKEETRQVLKLATMTLEDCFGITPQCHCIHKIEGRNVVYNAHFNDYRDRIIAQAQIYVYQYNIGFDRLTRIF